ncbi:hypothetical protein EST38_g10006 [Candolleomyces aberdarensis]|uniref:Uncharacterized protein n=1 Tax=Candolleomyces aberdarensis TaxID=2316362 RepID=A0A4Q2DAX1_9AGAR|nr:hypothetical protein EST38_g10006 [Candolleomyces aberdarensis]
MNYEISDIPPVAQPEAAEANSDQDSDEKAADARLDTIELTARWERQLDRITDEAGAEEDEEAGVMKLDGWFIRLS